MFNLGSPDVLEELLFCQDILGQIPSGECSFLFTCHPLRPFKLWKSCLSNRRRSSCYVSGTARIRHGQPLCQTAADHHVMFPELPEFVTVNRFFFDAVQNPEQDFTPPPRNRLRSVLSIPPPQSSKNPTSLDSLSLPFHSTHFTNTTRRPLTYLDSPSNTIPHTKPCPLSNPGSPLDRSPRNEESN